MRRRSRRTLAEIVIPSGWKNAFRLEVVRADVKPGDMLDGTTDLEVVTNEPLRGRIAERRIVCKPRRGVA